MKLLYLLLLSCFVCSCSHSIRNNDKLMGIQLDFDLSAVTDDSLFLSEFVSEAKQIPLKLPDGEVIGEVGQVFFTPSEIFVVDRRLNMVFRFDEDGNWLSSLNKLGEGPDEYLVITNFWVADSTMYIYDKRMQKINLYTCDGKYIRNIKCQYRCSDIAMTDAGSFLCLTPDFIFNNPMGVWMMDADGNYQKTLLDYEEKYPVIFNYWKYIYRNSSEELSVYSPISNTSYRYDHDSLSVNWRIGLKQATLQAYKGLSSSMDIKGDCFIPVCWLDATNYLFLIWGNIRGDEPAYTLYNNKDNQVKISKNLSVDVQGMAELGSPVVTNLSDCFVTSIPYYGSYILQEYRLR